MLHETAKEIEGLRKEINEILPKIKSFVNEMQRSKHEAFSRNGNTETEEKQN